MKNSTLIGLALVSVLGISSAACGGAPSADANGSPLSKSASVGKKSTRLSAETLTGVARTRADQLVSIFENGTKTIQYGYASYLGDGRGYTVGRGFTTATGDARDVVANHVVAHPDCALAGYLPTLKDVASSASDDVSGLAGFTDAWTAAAQQEDDFRGAQDALVDQQSFAPAMVRADAAGLASPLARAIIYDTVVMHGDGPDADGTQALMQRANDQVGGAPADGIDEATWIDAFLQIRKDDMTHPSNGSTQSVWSQATFRCDALGDAAHAGNWDLDQPVHVARGGMDETTD